MTRYETFVRASARVVVILLILTIPAGIYAFVVVRGQLASATALNLRTVSEIGSTIDDRVEALRQIATSLPKWLKQTELQPLVQQFRTNEWFRNLNTPEGQVQCIKPAIELLDTSVVTLKPGREPLISVMRCAPAIPEASLPPGTPSVATNLQVPLRDLIPRRTLASGLDAVIVADCLGEVLYADTRREFSVHNILEFGLADPPSKPNADDEESTAESPDAAACRGRTQSWVARRELGGTPVMVFAHPYWPAGLSRVEDETPTWYLLGVQTEAAYRRGAQVLPFELVVIISPLIVVAILAWPFLLIALSASSAKFGRGVPLSFAASLLVGAGLLSVIAAGLAGHYKNSLHRDQLLRSLGTDVENRFTAELNASLALMTRQDHGSNALVEQDQTLAQAITECAEVAAERPMTTPRCYRRFRPEDAAALLSSSSQFEFAFQMDTTGEHVGPHLSLRDSSSSRRGLFDRAYFQRAMRGRLWRKTTETGEPFFIEPIRSKDFGWALSSFVVSAFGQGGTGALDGTAVIVMIKRLQTFFEPILPLGVGLAVVKDGDGSATLDGAAWHAGDVLFHSVESRALIENILTETDNDATLALALTERRAGFVDVSYRGAPHRFYTRPLLTVPWTLIVTYEKELLRMSTWRTILGSTAALVSYLVFVVVAALVVERLVFRRNLPRWALPSAANHPLHRDGAIALTAIGSLLAVAGLYSMSPAQPPGLLWALLLGSMLAVYGLLVSRFDTAERASAAAAGGWQQRAFAAARESWRRSRIGNVLFVAGIALIVAPHLRSATFEPWTLALVAALLVAFVLPHRQADRGLRVDRAYVLFVLTLIAAVSLVPATLLAVDSYAYHREVYEKANLGHIATGTLKREAALKDEARRLQPSTFDRAGVPPFDPVDAVSCMGFFGRGSYEPFAECDAAVPVLDWAAAAESRFRTATSWFATRLPAEGPHAVLFAEGWRSRTDGDEKQWLVPRPLDGDEAPPEGPMRAVKVPRSSGGALVFAGRPNGLFDELSTSNAWDNGTAAALIAMLIAGVLVVLYLGWRSLNKVTKTFFGPPDIREATALQPQGDWTWRNAEEKAILRHLADGHLINCADDGAIRRLVTSGFVTLLPTPHLTNESLAAEIRATEPSDTEREFEQARGTGTWDAIRGPFFAILGVAALALVVAAPDALRSVMGVLAASATGVGVIVQVMNLMMRSKG